MFYLSTYPTSLYRQIFGGVCGPQNAKNSTHYKRVYLVPIYIRVNNYYLQYTQKSFFAINHVSTCHLPDQSVQNMTIPHVINFKLIFCN